MKFIDLFCGIGGFHQALTNIGCKCVFACDIDDKCRETYYKNYGIQPEKDINDINIKKIPKFDILCAGFPCQPFSKAGMQKGFADVDRGNLFFNICEIVKAHKPKYMILENVKNLVSHDNKNTWSVIKTNIDLLGYYTYNEPLILNVLNFNIPQSRERVVILCKRKDLGHLEEMPYIEKINKNKLKCSVSDVINNKYDKKYIISGKLKATEEIWNAFIKILHKNKIDMPKFPIWTDWWDCVITDSAFYDKYKNWIDKNRAFYQENKSILKKWLITSRKNELWIGAVRKFEWQAGNLIKNDSMNTVLWTARGSGIRVKRLNYTPTLVAMSMIPVYGPESRFLTPRELCRLQSFSDDFKFSDDKTIYRQLGNAVNVKMIEQCAKFLIFNEPLFDK
jgi:DNA (cytosine-5)-methyltransferase 1